MTTPKASTTNRRAHAAKVLVQSSKKIKNSEKLNKGALNTQIRLIRSDVVKLKKDLSHGVNLLKEWVDTKISILTLTRSK